jgi:hypothetical protein
VIGKAKPYRGFTHHRETKNIADTIGVEVWQLFYPQVGEVARKPGQRKSQPKRTSRKKK